MTKRLEIRPDDGLIADADDAGWEMPAGPGSTVAGRYRLVREIGSGGMGVVWEATDLVLGRRVALKVPVTARPLGPTEASRVLREARLAAALSHPGVTAVFDAGLDDDRPYAVMELVEGETLQSRMSGGPLPVTEVARIGAQVATALAT